MKIGTRLFAAACATLVAVGTTTLVVAQTPTNADKAAMDKPIKDFALTEMRSGKIVKLSSFQNKKPVVLVFMANRCGTTWTYEKEIGNLIKTGKAKGYETLIVHANSGETDAELRGQLETRNIPAPILDDKKSQALMRYLGTRATPTFYVIDKKMTLRYVGSFDDHHAAPFYVNDAVASVLAGKPVKTKMTRAYG